MVLAVVHESPFRQLTACQRAGQRTKLRHQHRAIGSVEIPKLVICGKKLRRELGCHHHLPRKLEQTSEKRRTAQWCTVDAFAKASFALDCQLWRRRVRGGR